MVPSLLQMHFTFPHPPLAHSSTVTDRVLSQPLCMEVDGGGKWEWDLQWALIQPGRSNARPPFSSSIQMLQLCTAPSDQNLILGYWPQTSRPLLTVRIGERQIQPRNRLILRGDGFGEWKTLFVFAKQHRSWGLRTAPLQDPVLSTLLFLLLPQVTLPEYLFSRCSV